MKNSSFTETIGTITIEFPSAVKDGEFYTLELYRKVETRTYKKIFTIPALAYDLANGQISTGCCFAEMWIIRNNPKYDYLYKEEKITL